MTASSAARREEFRDRSSGQFGHQDRTVPGDLSDAARLAWDEVDPYGDHHISDETIAAWAHRGVPVPTAFEWHRRGFAPFKAARWEANNFDPVEAWKWQHRGFGADDAKSWRLYGFDVKSAEGFDNHGFTPVDAAEWREEGGPEMVADLHEFPYVPDTGLDWADMHRDIHVYDLADPYDDVPTFDVNDPGPDLPEFLPSA